MFGSKKRQQRAAEQAERDAEQADQVQLAEINTGYFKLAGLAESSPSPDEIEDCENRLRTLAKRAANLKGGASLAARCGKAAGEAEQRAQQLRHQGIAHDRLAALERNRHEQVVQILIPPFQNPTFPDAGIPDPTLDIVKFKQREQETLEQTDADIPFGIKYLDDGMSL